MIDKNSASEPAAEDQLNETLADEALKKNGSPEADQASCQSDDDLLALLDERDQLKDQLLRVMAETENYKKRAERDKAEFLKRANEGLIRDLLPVLDNLERAISCAGSEEDCPDAALLQGLGLIQRDFNKVMEKNGVEPIEALGQPFDPEVHAAMMQQEDAEAEENTVLSVYQKGYLHHGRLIRPAQVVVSKKPAGGYDSGGAAGGGKNRGNKIHVEIK